MRKPIGLTVPHREVGYKEKQEKRAWVGLTMDEIDEIIFDDENHSLRENIEHTIAKLKEKNK
jgi:hypothetical protein